MTQLLGKSSAAVLAALSMAIFFCGCSKEDPAVKAAREEKAAQQAAAEQLAAEQAARPEFGDYAVCRFIEVRRDELAVIPGLGNFGLLIGTQWSLPMPSPIETLQEIEERLTAEYDRRMKEFREGAAKELEKKFEEEVGAAYPLFQKGDDISLTLHNGVGPSAQVQGKLVSVGRDRVLIGKRWVAKPDLSAEEQARFFPDARAAFISQAASKRCREAFSEKMDELSKAHEKALREAWSAAGYVPNILVLSQRGMKVDAKYWMTKQALLKRVREYLRSPAGTEYDDELQEYEDEAP